MKSTLKNNRQENYNSGFELLDEILWVLFMITRQLTSESQFKLFNG
jgi:hypothetical protein